MGEILVSFCSNLNSLIKLDLAKALALRKAMLISLKLQIPKAVFEGDCFKVISAVNSSKNVGKEVYSIIHNIRKLL